jgi:serine/threonine protein kinase/DNA-binding response OmpR family regulator
LRTAARAQRAEHLIRAQENNPMPGDRTRANLSSEEFMRNLSDSGLVPAADVTRTLGSAVGQDTGTLVRQLIDTGALTDFQADAVMERRFDALRIGNYEVLERLGAGGMGTVFKARHRRMKRIVALKLLGKEVASAPAFVARFQREVETIAQLNHPNIVMAYDADEAEAGPFLIMEFVDGRDLSSEVQKNGPLPAQTALDVLVQSARGLQYAHERGLVHRDIKPANLLRDRSGVVKVADLGLARFSSRGKEGSSSITQAGAIVGTMDYMSPEQAMDSGNVDHRADVYSLGCTLYYLLTAQPPYTGNSLMALLLKHSAGTIPSLCAARPDLPAELDALFQKMVAKQPEDRQQSMAEVIAALEKIAALVEAAPASVSAPLQLGEAPVDMSSATVEVQLPAPTRQASEPLAATGRGLAGLSVVVAEPSRTQAGIIRKYLHELGIQDVHAAASGKEALALASKVRPQVLLSAMHLSDMTGAQLAAAPECAGLGVVLITSQDADTSATGRAVLMYKPFDQKQLARALAQATGRSVDEAPGQGASRPTDNLKVLIADDSAAARAHIRAVLRGLGFHHFSEVKDGIAAVELLQKERFDLIVSDYNMPGHNGAELVRFVRQESTMPKVPVLMVTTETDPTLREKMRQAGVSAICEKSFKPEVVRTLIERLL